MLLVANTSWVDRAEQLENQNPREIVQIAQLLLHIENRDPAWHTRARLEIVTLQRLIQHERHWLNSFSEPQAKRHLHNSSMTP